MNQTYLENIQLKEFVFHLQHTLQYGSGLEHNKHLKDKTRVNNATSLLGQFWVTSLLSLYCLYTPTSEVNRPDGGRREPITTGCHVFSRAWRRLRAFDKSSSDSYEEVLISY